MARDGDRLPSPAVIVPEPAAPLPGPFEVRVQVRSEHTHGVLAVIGETLAPRVLVGDEVHTARAGQWRSSPATSSMPCEIPPTSQPGSLKS